MRTVDVCMCRTDYHRRTWSISFTSTRNQLMYLSFVRMSEFTAFFFFFICFNFCNFFLLYFFYSGVFHLSCESTTHFNFLRWYFSSIHICHSHAFYTRFVTSFSLTLSPPNVILFRSQLSISFTDRSHSLSRLSTTVWSSWRDIFTFLLHFKFVCWYEIVLWLWSVYGL